MLEHVVDHRLDRVCASCRRAASMRRFDLLSGSACDSRIQLFSASSTGETASVSSRLEPVENDHRADDESDIHDESGNRVHAIGRALWSAGLHARDRFSKNVKASVGPLIACGNSATPLLRYTLGVMPVTRRNATAELREAKLSVQIVVDVLRHPSEPALGQASDRLIGTSQRRGPSPGGGRVGLADRPQPAPAPERLKVAKS
jgi:hypothetical protein